MNKIIYKYDTNITLTFTDQVDSGQGKIIEGSFYNETSLLEDELSIDTMTVKVRYERATPSLISFTYGSEVEYYKDDKLYARYYLKDVERNSKYEYTFSLQSAIGLLDDTNHYGGIYSGQSASDIIKDIIGGKITYTEHSIFSKIKVYGWLPVATRRDNLKQLLFAVGGCVKKKDGIINFSTLTVDTPIGIPANRVYDSGKITYNAPASRIEVIEHQFSKVDNAQAEDIYVGEIVGSSFTSPKGYVIDNGAIITWDEPHHSITFDGCSLLNNEVGVNYAVVSSSASATIKGKPYIHSKLIVSRDKENYQGKEKVAKVEEATLVTLANSNSVAEKVMAYYDTPSTLSGSIVLNDEKPLDNLTMPNQFEEESTGIIKSIEGTFGQQITKGEVEVRLGYNPPPIYGSRELVSIAIKTPPNKTTYEAGDYFDKTGMVIEATYDDGNKAIVKNYSVSPSVLTKDTTKVIITYREMGVVKNTELNVVVKNLLKTIAITTPPDETAYEIGETISLAGMVLEAYYSDGSSKVVENYTYSPQTVRSNNDTEITISYTEDGITKTTIQEITIGNTPNLTGISIITNPDKMTYRAGEFFDKTGMVVVASFDDGNSKAIRGYTYTPTSALGKDDTTITVSYTKKGITKTATLTIVIIYLTSIAITQEPTYKSYYDTESFNTQGMEITAYYSDNTNKVITTYTYSPSGVLPYGTTQIVVSYTDGGITQTANQPITVSIKTYDYTKSTVISAGGSYTLSGIGATHRNIRVVCIGGGTGGNGGRNGSSGRGGGSASVKLNGGYDIASAGSGGAGGSGGNGGSGGKIFQKDFIIPKLTDTFTISIGSGGSGGGTASTGSAGGNTTFTYNGTTASSATGSSSSTGYTNTFTNATYAINGNMGIAGGDGGDGFEITRVTGTGMLQWSYYNPTSGKSVVYNGTTYTGGGTSGYSDGVVYYSNVSIGVVAGGSGSGGASAGRNSANGNYSRVNGSQQSPRFVAWCASGGAGASAVAPSAPTTYGNGGNGGNGGGGGGGASGGVALYGQVNYGAESNPYKNDNPKVNSGSGGSGGSGSSGSSGAQGCVIIYFS